MVMIKVFFLIFLLPCYAMSQQLDFRDVLVSDVVSDKPKNILLKAYTEVDNCEDDVDHLKGEMSKIENVKFISCEEINNQSYFVFTVPVDLGGSSNEQVKTLSLYYDNKAWKPGIGWYVNTDWSNKFPKKMNGSHLLFNLINNTKMKYISIASSNSPVFNGYPSDFARASLGPEKSVTASIPVRFYFSSSDEKGLNFTTILIEDKRQPKQPSQEFIDAKRLAEKGDMNAQFRLAEMYDATYGKDIDHDSTLALKWYTQSAKQGHVEAQYILGEIYKWRGQSQGINEKYREAAEWYSLAAQQGHPASQYELGILLLNGKGIQQNVDKGIELIEKSALSGNYSAKDMMGYIYLNGSNDEVKPDYIKAYGWLTYDQEKKERNKKLVDFLKEKMTQEDIDKGNVFAAELNAKSK